MDARQFSDTPAPEYLPWREASAIHFGIRRSRAMRKAIEDGSLVSYRIGGRICVRPVDVRNWLAAQRIPVSDHARARLEQVKRREARA